MNRREVIAVLIGAVIMLIPFSLDLTDFPSALLWTIGGFAGAFLARKGIKNGILTGFLTALIASIPIFVFFGGLSIKPAEILFIALFIVLMSMFSIPGGVIGGLLNRWKFKTIEKNKLIIYLTFTLGILLLLSITLLASHYNVLAFFSNIFPIILILSVSLATFAIYLLFRKLPWKYRFFFILILPLLIQGFIRLHQGDNSIFTFIPFILAAILFYFVLKAQNKSNKNNKAKIDTMYSNKDDTLNEIYNTEINKDYWFRYEEIYDSGISWRFARPVRWQGWACLGIFISACLIIPAIINIIINPSGNTTTQFVIIGATVLPLFLIFFKIATLKSDRRKLINNYKAG